MERKSPLEGQGFVLNIHKEKSWTSHDVVARIRRILSFRKVGHTGTLDPFATGVLVCCVGRATKLSNVLMGRPKEYTGKLYFGKTTDSGDCTGDVTETWDLPMPTLKQFQAATVPLTGHIQQVPPMVSAIKQDGVRLYKLARQGITVPRKARDVFIKSFEILGIEGNLADFRVRCSKGTYIRSLVQDLAVQLGAGAYVEELCRTQVGGFRLGEAVKLTDEMTAGQLLAQSMTMNEAVTHLPVWRVPTVWAGKLRRGQIPPWTALKIDNRPKRGEQGRLVNKSGDLLALGRAELTPGPIGREWHEELELKLVRVI